LAVILGLAGAGAGIVPAEEPDAGCDPARRLSENPELLRTATAQRELQSLDPACLASVLRAIAADDTRDWDLRAHALVALPEPAGDAAAAAFVHDFDPLAVAADSRGADTYELLSEWASSSAPTRDHASGRSRQRP
jgi:hypothetical protein